ncbi:MAG: fumarylacetoacetase [Betaproteobacteria bacterium]|nr:fumarylacetoacetase [Betaproteobacteria bacterium]
MIDLNETHDPRRRSWVESANRADSDFPIQNLPFGVFRRRGEAARGGVAIGDCVLDLSAAIAAGLFAGETAVAAPAAAGATLNPLMAMGLRPASALRRRLSDMLRADGPERDRVQRFAGRLLVSMAEAEMELPAAIGSFTDFLTSYYHIERGRLHTTSDSAVHPSFKYLPFAYHGRATSVRVGGKAVRRPNGQWKRANGEICFGPTEALDFELELGAFIGPGNELGVPIPIEAAPAHVFGYCLVNDWTARDVQRWQSALGPFLGKSHLTTISPWVITAEAMAPFHAPAFSRPKGDPLPLPYLHAESDQAKGGLDLNLEAFLVTPHMREAGQSPSRITKTNFRHMYWTFAQMVTHHASNGCDLQPGDLLASGTASGPTDDSRACMSELTARGSQPLRLPNGETRKWLEDGDEIILRARAVRNGHVSVGFGECRGRVVPALAWPVAGRAQT